MKEQPLYPHTLEKAFIIAQIICSVLMSLISTAGVIVSIITCRTFAETAIYFSFAVVSILGVKMVLKELKELKQ